MAYQYQISMSEMKEAITAAVKSQLTRVAPPAYSHTLPDVVSRSICDRVLPILEGRVTEQINTAVDRKTSIIATALKDEMMQVLSDRLNELDNRRSVIKMEPEDDSGISTQGGALGNSTATMDTRAQHLIDQAVDECFRIAAREQEKQIASAVGAARESMIAKLKKLDKRIDQGNDWRDQQHKRIKFTIARENGSLQDAINRERSRLDSLKTKVAELAQPAQPESSVPIKRAAADEVSPAGRRPPGPHPERLHAAIGPGASTSSLYGRRLPLRETGQQVSGSANPCRPKGR